MLKINEVETKYKMALTDGIRKAYDWYCTNKA